MSISEFEDAYDSEDAETNDLGEVLETPICELSLRDPLIVEVSATAADAIAAMNEHHIGCVLVGKQGLLAGIFTERDVLRFAANGLDFHSTLLGSVMTPNPETVLPDQSIAFALNHMSVGGFRHIPVVDQAGRPVAVVSVRDVVNFLVDLCPTSVLNLPPDPPSHHSVDGG